MGGKAVPDQLLARPKRASPDTPSRDTLLEEEIGRIPNPCERRQTIDESFEVESIHALKTKQKEKARHGEKNQKVVWDRKTN